MKFSDKLDLHWYELCTGILSNASTYPWQPQASEAEDFFSLVEGDFACEEVWSEEELQKNTEYFFNSLEECWPKNRGCQLLQILHEEFSELLPLKYLEQISQQIDLIKSRNRVLTSELLVECARSLLPDWLETDLQIFARPYVNAMRQNSPNSSVSAEFLRQTSKNKSWQDFSEIEKARSIIEIIHYALRAEVRSQKSEVRSQSS